MKNSKSNFQFSDWVLWETNEGASEMRTGGRHSDAAGGRHCWRYHIWRCSKSGTYFRTFPKNCHLWRGVRSNGGACVDINTRVCCFLNSKNNLCSTTQHLILIGDHLQLRPKTEVYQLSVDSHQGFDLDRSLFERMVGSSKKFRMLNSF